MRCSDDPLTIGYYVEDAAHEAFVMGLARRWCPDAKLEEGRFRGQSKESFRREVRKSLEALYARGCLFLVVLADSDSRPWRDVLSEQRSKIPDNLSDWTLTGVAERNIECWLCLDAREFAPVLECAPTDFQSLEDPSGFVKRALGLTSRLKRIEGLGKIRDFLVAIPLLKTWLRKSDSFKDFYDQARRVSQRADCKIRNEWGGHDEG